MRKTKQTKTRSRQRPSGAFGGLVGSPSLLEAAQFALSVLKHLPPTEMSERMAIEKLEVAIASEQPAIVGLAPTHQASPRKDHLWRVSVR